MHPEGLASTQECEMKDVGLAGSEESIKTKHLPCRPAYRVQHYMAETLMKMENEK